MLKSNSAFKIPAHVTFVVVEEEAVLLNTRTNKYFALGEVGARLWSLLSEGKNLLESCQTLLDEYEVEPAQLEKDILELLDQLVANGLLEIVQS